MKFSIVFLSCFMLYNSLIYSQQTDTIEIWQLEQKAIELFKTFRYDSAAHYYFQAAKIYEQQKNQLKTVKNYRLTANSFNLVSKSDTALYFIQKALNLSNNYFIENTKNETFEKTGIHITFGDIYVELGKYNEGLQCYENALNLVLQADSLETLKIAKIWNCIGGAYFYKRQYDKAIEFCEKSLETIKSIQGNNHIDLAKPLFNLGEIYFAIESLNKSLEYFQKLLKIRIQKFGESHPDIALAYDNIGFVYSRKGFYETAHTYYKKSLQINIQTLGENHPNLITSYFNLGKANFYIGDYDKAFEYFQKAIQINQNGGNKYYLIKCYNFMSNIYRIKNNGDNAFEYSQKALKLSVLTYGESHPRAMPSYNNMGGMYNFKNDYDKALENYTKALNIMLPTNVAHLAKIYNNIGRTYSYKKDHDKALGYYQKAAEIRVQTYGEHNPFLAYNYNDIASESDMKNDFKKALEYYQKALMANLVNFYDTNLYHNPKHFNAFSKPALLNTLTSKAKSLYFLYKNTNISAENIEASVLTYELTFKLLHEMRNDYSNESMKLLISEEYKRYFTDAIYATLELNKVDPSIENKEKTFDFIEKAQSATLGTYLNNMELKKYFNISDSLLGKEKTIAINRCKYETKIQQLRIQKNSYDTLLVKNYQDSLFNYSRQYDNLTNTLEHNYPEYFALKYKQETAEIKDIQNELNNNTALINYFIGDTSLFICSLTKERYNIKAIKTDSLFNEKIIDYYIDIKSDFTGKELKNSSYLYKYLIEPIEEDLKNKDKLIIIPDGNLYYIPFETLCKSNTYTEDLSAIDFLIKDYSVTYHHTATLWLSNKEKEQNQYSTKDNFIGFAPVFDPKINNGFIVSSEWIQDTSNAELASRSISSNFTHFNALPYSENEVESVVKLFNKKRKEAKGFFYKEANEENFKNNIHNYKYIHIASHSFTNDLYPNLSGIAFSQPDTSSVYNEDGILYAGETYNLNLQKADLITLSSCKSGLGKLIQGEGFLSLSRGFLYSGTPNIIFSLWNVKDEQTKDLMINFYKQVLHGTDYASALRKAKLSLISNPKTASPKYWGAWMLVGR